jgi:CcmD family protein
MTGASVLGELPALPLHEAGKYVAGAYLVVFVVVLTYVAIMAVRLSRIERELGELLARETAAVPEGHGQGQATSPASSTPTEAPVGG